MKNVISCLFSIVALLFLPATGYSSAPISAATEECLMCHAVYHPGIVEDWKNSRHAVTTPKAAMSVQGLSRKVSAVSVPSDLHDVAVGCAECHTLRSEKHDDAFEHNEVHVHVVVSPDDCGVCHVSERAEFSKNIMSHARKNLTDNLVYQQLQHAIIGTPLKQGNTLGLKKADDKTEAEACAYCHGTKLENKGTEPRETPDGEMDFPVIEGWPNQGVGRINLDGSMGACSACHSRHRFSIETARKPYTCQECHHGPDVPAYKVYSASKHGNLFSTENSSWNFTAVPWTIGKDFTAPTCATCHISLLVNPEKQVVSQRTHQMSDRLSWRIFGLIYAHPQPKDPDTTGIRNSDNLPLPTDFSGNFATDFLIDAKESRKRAQTMQTACMNCHSASWVKGFWNRYETTIRATNESVKAATDIMTEIWSAGYADGSRGESSLFDEAIERKWSDIWLFYANTIRFSSAMAGGGDYGIFAEGRYQLSKEILELQDWFTLRKKPAVDNRHLSEEQRKAVD